MFGEAFIRYQSRPEIVTSIFEEGWMYKDSYFTTECCYFKRHVYEKENFLKEVSDKLHDRMSLGKNVV